MKATFLAVPALLLSAAAAAAAPAVTEAPLNLHARASARSVVIGTVPGGATVDVRGCIRSWCRVRFGREIGFAPRRLLALAGGPPVVAAAPGYVYDEPYYDYYDYGYDYGPSVGVFVGPGGRFHHRRWDGRAWQGRTGSGTRSGTWQGGAGSTGARANTWHGGGRNVGATTGTTGIARGGNMAPGSVTPQVSAPAAGPAIGGGAAVSAPPAAAGGAVTRSQGR